MIPCRKYALLQTSHCQPTSFVLLQYQHRETETNESFVVWLSSGVTSSSWLNTEKVIADFKHKKGRVYCQYLTKKTQNLSLSVTKVILQLIPNHTDGGHHAPTTIDQVASQGSITCRVKLAAASGAPRSLRFIECNLVFII